MRNALMVLTAMAAAWSLPAGTAVAQVSEPACVESGRPDPSRPDLLFQREAFGFHDEEIVICSPGAEHPAHIAARIWVPKGCEVPGSCPGVLISHGFAFSKEFTFADMQNAAGRKMTVLSYDVRGHGASGGQVGLMGREEIADQAAVLEWFHANVEPTKVGVYGVSQGGAHAVMAAIFNCGKDRAASFDSTTDCDSGGRWVDAIAPIQGPTEIDRDLACSTFGAQAVPQSRFSPGLTREALRCAAGDTPLAGAMIAATEALTPLDLSMNDYISRADRIDVPAYLVTTFYDRLVLPQNMTRLYEILDARGDYAEDLRLLISSEGHGAVGGNFAVLDDVFAWFARMLDADTPVKGERVPPVVITQEWDDNSFRLESDWPIPGTTTRARCLSRTSADPFSGGLLVDCDPAPGAGIDELQNLPVLSSPPSVPFLDFVNQITATTSVSQIPAGRLIYEEVMDEEIEITGLPEVSLWVSSNNPEGKGQLHVALLEVSADGSVTEFARNRRGLRNLNPNPTLFTFPLTVSSHRVQQGNRLVVMITPNDIGETVPYLSSDTTRIHRGGSYPSSVTLPLVDPDRTQPAGDVPSGPAFPGNAVGAICSAFGQDCEF